MSTRFRLRSDLTPMENLWACIRQAVFVFYKSTPYPIRMNKEETEDFLAHVELRVFLRFKLRVLKHKYDRRYTLWNNVWWVVWCSFGKTLDEHYKQIRRRLDARTQGLENIGHGEVLHHATVVNRAKDTRVFSNSKYAIDFIKRRYAEYVEDTENEGLTPVPLLDFARVNYPDHWADFLEEMTGDRGKRGWGSARKARPKIKKKEPPKVETPTTERLYRDAGMEPPKVYIWDRLKPWD